MSITTQEEALRSHHEPEERYSYDPEHPYVYGDVSQFKRDVSPPPFDHRCSLNYPYKCSTSRLSGSQIGTVIAKFQVGAGGEVANVVYVSHLNPLYFSEYLLLRAAIYRRDSIDPPPTTAF